MNLLIDLNVEQEKAVKANGSVVIIAGPGTGKTKTLIARVAYLIQEKHISTDDILALTFTKKAATEMRERLHFLPKSPLIATFHSFAVELLKTTGKKISIISDSDREDILKIVYKKNMSKDGDTKSIRDLSLIISRYKAKLHGKKSDLIQEYNKLLKVRNCIDYDDVLLHAHELLETTVQKQFSHILVDEFQDTNSLQFQIIKLLSKESSIFVIGDPYQSIYSFRGASEHVFNAFKKDFPDARVINFSNNYRSTKEIIASATSLFPNEIQLTSEIDAKGVVQHIQTVNEFTEAEWVIQKINTEIGGTDLIQAGKNKTVDNRNISFKDFAVLYRTHALSRILESSFHTAGIPYQIVGGNSVFEKPEIDFIKNALYYISEPTAKYLHSLLISPILQLSKKSKQSLQSLFQSEENYMYTVCNHVEQISVSESDLKYISTHIHFLNRVSAEAQNKNVIELVHMLSTLKCFQQYLVANTKRELSINHLLSILTQFKKKKNSLEKTISHFRFLEEHEYYDPFVDNVTLLSMHAAKGLEFSQVFITGFEEGIVPLIRKNKLVNTEEEKRLLYVAMTRAKKGLYLLSPRVRCKKKTRPSQFKQSIKDVEHIQDVAIEKRSKQIKKWKEKKSQLKLF